MPRFLTEKREQAGCGEENKRPREEIADAAIQSAARIDVEASRALTGYSSGAAKFLDRGDLAGHVRGERGIGREIGGVVASEILTRAAIQAKNVDVSKSISLLSGLPSRSSRLH